MEKKIHVKKRQRPAFTIVRGFFVVIFIGAILLNTPWATASGEMPGFLDSLFTATSAVCVTGLVVVDTGTFWSSFGKFVILLLIQIGGLGFMSLTTLAAILLGKKITLRERIIIQESLNQTDLSGIVKLNKHIMMGTFLVEGIGALLLSTQFIPEFGLIKGVSYGIFHSISAFCNAGFDLMGNYSSFTGYTNNYVINFTLIALIVLGGMGFTVIFDIVKKRKFMRLNLHSKLVLVMTGILILSGTILFFLIEKNNPGTLGTMAAGEKVTASLFQSVTTRTAGFNTIDQNSMLTSSKLLTIVLMFIGGAPTSTAGGIKVTTIAIIALTVFSFMRGDRDVQAFNRRISFGSVKKAIAALCIMQILVFIGVLVLSMADPSALFLSLLFETTSAIGTVGLSLGITSSLNVISKIILIILMFIGRVGVITVVIAGITNDKKSGYQLPEEKVII